MRHPELSLEAMTLLTLAARLKPESPWVSYKQLGVYRENLSQQQQQQCAMLGSKGKQSIWSLLVVCLALLFSFSALSHRTQGLRNVLLYSRSACECGQLHKNMRALISCHHWLFYLVFSSMLYCFVFNITYLSAFSVHCIYQDCDLNWLNVVTEI